MTYVYTSIVSFKFLFAFSKYSYINVSSTMYDMHCSQNTWIYHSTPDLNVQHHWITKRSLPLCRLYLAFPSLAENANVSTISWVYGVSMSNSLRYLRTMHKLFISIHYFWFACNMIWIHALVSVSLTNKNVYRQSQYSKTWESKCLAPLGQIVEHSVNIRRLGFKGTPMSIHLLSQNFDPFSITSKRELKANAGARGWLIFQKLTFYSCWD